ncbi:hypothetical protein WMY93_022356 [Mugilogobius chulae]|uniref:C-type lectin domain-containing protein n=1 Tax=Mugilogobius chulae TaxID=88201 RepID=A0AAW0NB24_9GOBI
MEVRRQYLEFLLLLLVFPAASWKYVYVSYSLNWNAARLYCTTNYTDLAPVSNEHDQAFLINFTGYYWIGLMRNTENRKMWEWSGGAELSKTFWDLGEPNGFYIGEEVVVIHSGFWHDIGPSQSCTFFCYKVHAIRQRKTWYEALDYCRQNHQDLASVASETEMMLIGKELRKGLSSQNIWIGLQFLDNKWLWMDGQTFNYESWGPNPKLTCPNIDQACGAVRVNGKVQILRVLPKDKHESTLDSAASSTLADQHGNSGKYVYERLRLNWLQAQTYCRTNHTDLASIDSLYDLSLIPELRPNIGSWSWIGLEKTSESKSGWKWSGGTDMSLEKQFWAVGEPNNANNVEDKGGIWNAYANSFWVDAQGTSLSAFFCYKVNAIREKKTWYEALDYCRENHKDLASVASETEMMHIQRELEKQLSRFNVWIGLQFLAGEWVWVDGQPFRYEFWGSKAFVQLLTNRVERYKWRE